MYYSKGNYEAFITTPKPKGIEEKSAYLVGGGLASLAAAAFLIRDGHMSGKSIHILEELPIPGGSLDGNIRPEASSDGFVMRGGREMEEHFETLWDLFRSIPSLEEPSISVLDEFNRLNEKGPSFSHTRIIEKRGEQLPSDGKLKLSEKSIKELIDFVMIPEVNLDDKKINEIFSPEFFESNFWLYWATMFAFEQWASATEMRRYLLRFVHQISSLSDMSALKFSKYNQYESLIKPLISYLENNEVNFEYDTVVENIILDKGLAKRIIKTSKGVKSEIELTEDDLLFVTNGSITESSTYGNNNQPAIRSAEIGAAWMLWQNIAYQDGKLGNPEKFYKNIPEANWVISGTITLKDDRALPYIEKISKKDPHSGSIVTSGPVTIKDSNWLYGYSVNRQPVFKNQKENETIVWVYGLLSDTKGNYVKKAITEATGSELTAEWLYHIGVPESEIDDIANNGSSTIPVCMPYITSYFMPRSVGDRPQVLPKGYRNLAFIGNFAETERDTVFTTEYSTRTAMEAVYGLLNIQRGVPEVYGSSFDVRTLAMALYYANDKKSLKSIKLSSLEKLATKTFLKKIEGTYLEEILKEANLL